MIWKATEAPTGSWRLQQIAFGWKYNRGEQDFPVRPYWVDVLLGELGDCRINAVRVHAEVGNRLRRFLGVELAVASQFRQRRSHD